MTIFHLELWINSHLGMMMHLSPVHTYPMTPAPKAQTPTAPAGAVPKQAAGPPLAAVGSLLPVTCGTGQKASCPQQKGTALRRAFP